MPTIDERCYGHEPAATELRSLRRQANTLATVLNKLNNAANNWGESLREGHGAFEPDAWSCLADINRIIKEAKQ